jgi:signal transduction histidine kinase
VHHGALRHAPGVGFGPSPQSEAVGLGFGTRRASGLLQTVGYPLGVLLLTAVYYGAAHLGYALEFTGPIAGIVWLPVGVGISFLYLGGLRYWPGVLIGDLLVNNYSALPVGSAIGQTFGNILEVVLAAWLIQQFVPGGNPLGGVRSLTRLLLILGLGTAVSATVGLISLRLGDVMTTAELPKLWRTWWLGDMSGALMVVPLMIAWHRPPPRSWLARATLAEGILLLAAIIAVSELAVHTSRPVAYLEFPLLMIAAFRFSTRGATLALVIASGYEVWATTHYIGAFAFNSITESVLTTQLFITVASVTTLALAAVLAERDRYSARLRASRARIVRAADDERRRIEHNLHDGAQQRLTALAIYLGMAADEARDCPSQAPALFDKAERNLLLAIDELRELAHGMHPPALCERGLAQAIRSVTADCALPVTFDALPSRRLDDAAEATAYFTLVEAITNAQKHSYATSLHVNAHWSEGWLTLDVADNGVGGANESSGLGLQGLRDRIEAFGGSFEVGERTGGGTRLTAAIPASAAER